MTSVVVSSGDEIAHYLRVRDFHAREKTVDENC